jgi:hypothetical protein
MNSFENYLLYLEALWLKTVDQKKNRSFFQSSFTEFAEVDCLYEEWRGQNEEEEENEERKSE